MERTLIKFMCIWRKISQSATKAGAGEIPRVHVKIVGAVPVVLLYNYMGAGSRQFTGCHVQAGPFRYCSQVPRERNRICPFKIACGDGAYALPP